MRGICAGEDGGRGRVSPSLQGWGRGFPQGGGCFSRGGGGDGLCQDITKLEVCFFGLFRNLEKKEFLRFFEVSDFGLGYPTIDLVDIGTW